MDGLPVDSLVEVLAVDGPLEAAVVVSLVAEEVLEVVEAVAPGNL